MPPTAIHADERRGTRRYRRNLALTFASIAGGLLLITSLAAIPL